MKSIRLFIARLRNTLDALFGRGLVVAVGVILLIALLVAGGILAFVNSATPDTLTIASGPPGSSYQRNAEKYKAILAREGVTLKIIPSEGSLDNLKKLLDPKAKVDVAFVMGGEIGEADVSRLVSLGSVAYQPLMVFYRGEKRSLISEFEGKRLYIGQEGSGTRMLASALLKANGIDAGEVRLPAMASSEEAVKVFRDGGLDAIFLMGDSTAGELMRGLLRAEDVRLLGFGQAEGYTRRITYLNRLELPMGALDFGKNIPAEDMQLLAPTVQLVARDGIHPALVDVLLEAAREVHGKPGLFRKRGEFPASRESEFRMSEDATRYYSSGKGFLYRTFPFWAASLITRILAVVVPLALLLIPALKSAPAVYRWRMESRIYRWYRALFELEKEAARAALDAEKYQALLNRLNHIEQAVSKIVIPAAFGDLFYGLRSHIALVRDNLEGKSVRVEEGASGTAPGA